MEAWKAWSNLDANFDQIEIAEHNRNIIDILFFLFDEYSYRTLISVDHLHDI